MRYLLGLLILFTGCTRTSQTSHIEDQRSPYLQQSQNDGIWWYPWGETALNQAKNQDKLIFLSIGYATCSACMRMQTTVYDDQVVREKLNKTFVSIKVDREERPDLDAYFLNMQTAIMKFGAWPIHLVLTPNLKPAFATTYMEKTSFLRLLGELEVAWSNDKKKILTESSAFLEKIKPVANQNQTEFSRDQSLIKDFYARYTHRFDSAYGGLKLGNNYAPKFPVNDDMRLLLRYHFQTKEKQALQMVKKTLSTQLKSAVFDQLEGGLHRYSITRNWNVPNFEKTLQDQAGFINALVELNQLAPNALYTDKLEKTVAFLLRSFKSSLGGFYSSQGATSKNQEGLYFTWQRHEIETVLGRRKMSLFDQYFALTPKIPKYSQRSALYSKSGFDSPERQEVVEMLTQSKYKSTPPVFDKKIVTASNAYILSALARLAQVWPSKEFEKIITKNIDYLLLQHRNLRGHLYRNSINGEVRYPGVVDDYAFLIDALIEYYQLTFQEEYLFKAKALQTIQDELFFDSGKKLYKLSATNSPLHQPQFLLKDQDMPSGQSMSYWNLIRLSRYFQDNEYGRKAEALLEAYPDQLHSDPLSYKHLLIGLDFTVSKSKNLIMAAPIETCQQRAKELNRSFFPYKLLSCASKHSRLPLNQYGAFSEGKENYRLCYQDQCSPTLSSFSNVKDRLFKRDL